MSRTLRLQALLFLLIGACLLISDSASCQNESIVFEAIEPAAKSAETAEEESEKSSFPALRSVLQSIEEIELEIEELSKTLEEATDVDREAIEANLRSLATHRDELHADFDSIATGINPEDFDKGLDEGFILSDELDALLQPIIQELKDLTEKPREIEELRSDLYTWKRRLEATEAAITNLSELPPVAQGSLAEHIAGTKEKWNERQRHTENRIQAIEFQLEQAEENQPTFFSSITSSLRSFFRSRGLNLLLCILVFFSVFFALRYLHRRVEHLTPWRRKGDRAMHIRLIDVGLNVVSVVGAIIATLIVLYATGDWVLMGLAVILLFSLALAAKNGLPVFYDQTRLLLNLGEVREGERVVFNGVPWKIERLSFFSTLINEQLRGGHLRLPVRQLATLISRPIAKEGELWFPCAEGDWIILADEGHCRVVSQTPEYVQIVKLGGAKATIPTVDFLGKSPLNLSHNFRITTVFGIDYKHQAESTTTIPETLWAHLIRELYNSIGDHEKLISLKVELSSAGASSLDYAILADFHGDLASRYRTIQRDIIRILVDCCNENGYEIPFSQITLHNAFPVEPSDEEEPAIKKAKLP